MVTVPQYQQTETLRPEYRQGIDVQASPGDFGAQIGQGMQQVAQGGMNLAGSLQTVRDLDDTMRAKDADNKYGDWLRNRMYGESGFMTLDGRNAIDGRKGFEDEAAQKQKEFGSGLTGGAARTYDTASQARLNSTLQSSIVHTAQERKSWFADSSSARVDGFANDALTQANNPDAVDKSIAAGQAELRQRGAMLGWDADQQKKNEQQFISGVRKNVTLSLAQKDPLAAKQYMSDHADQFSGEDLYNLNSSLKAEFKGAEAKKAVADVFATGRSVTGQPTDIVADVASGTGKDSGGAKGGGGPTVAKAFLNSISTHKDRPGDTLNLDDAFSSNLSAMIQDAPPEIRAGLGITSGFRSNDLQKQLFDKSDKTGRTVAFPAGYVKPNGQVAQGSEHLHGRAVDLSWNGALLNHAPQNVIDYVHQNAGKYGLYFPMAYEPWHIQPTAGGSSTAASPTVAASSNVVSSRSLMPSADEVERRLSAISDPDVQDLARKMVYARMETAGRVDQENQKAAKAQLWKYVDQGMTPDQVPMDVRQQAGMDAVSSAWGYLKTAASGRAVDSDQTLLYDMRKYAATNPTEFANVDLNNYRDKLSKEDIKELTGTQTSALTDTRKAKEAGIKLTSAFSQAGSQLDAIGITTDGKQGSAREEAAKRIALFQNSLVSEMQAFKQANNDRPPTQADIQQMINKLILPIAIKTPGTLYGTNTDTSHFLFEAGNRPDGSTVTVTPKYTDIPIDLRRGIALDLERERGRKPSEQEIVERYQYFMLHTGANTPSVPPEKSGSPDQRTENKR